MLCTATHAPAASGDNVVAAAPALLQFLQMNDTLNKGNSDMGTCGRIFFYAMPYAITSMCSGVLEIWLLLMPLATVVDSPPRSTPGVYQNVPAVLVDLMLYVLACVLMMGVEDVAVQLEQPFAHMPLTDMADATLRAVTRWAGAGVLALVGGWVGVQCRRQRLSQLKGSHHVGSEDKADKT